MPIFGGLTAQVVWLGLGVGGHPALSLNSSDEPDELCPSVTSRHGNDWTNLAGFWHGCFLPPIPHYVLRKFGYLQN